MNTLLSLHWSVWVRGVVAALVSGAATGVGALLVVPEALSTAQPHAILKVAAVGAVVGLAGYLKQSPLPDSAP